MQKDYGGLGIKQTKLMNDVCLFEILWNLLNNSNDLWCQVLINKQGKKQILVENTISKSNDSPLWKSREKVGQNFHKKTLWKLGDGIIVNFWLDHWTPTERPLLSELVNPYTIIYTTFMVNGMINAKVKWNLELLQNWFNVDLVKCIHEDGVDVIG